MVVSANSSWNIVNFRSGLIRAIGHAGYEPIVIAPFDEACNRRLAELGVEHIDVPVQRSGLNPLADVALLLRYRTIVRQLRPAAFLGFTIKPNIYGCLAARSLGIPAIANISGLGTVFSDDGWLMRLALRLYRIALGGAHRVFFQNPDDRMEFISRGIVGEEQAGLLPGSGVDLQQFAPAPLPPNGPVFLLVARLLVDKGVREYVAAARILRSEFPSARFQLLGPIDEGNPTGISQTELERWIASEDLEYLGSVEDVRDAIRGATAIVLPSYYREGVPRSLLEGAAMARPLIATDMPGCRELVVNQPGGIACRPRDAGSLADAMRELAQLTSNEWSAMGLASRQLIERRFGEEKIIRAYLDELARVAPIA